MLRNISPAEAHDFVAEGKTKMWKLWIKVRWEHLVAWHNGCRDIWPCMLGKHKYKGKMYDVQTQNLAA